MSEEQRKERVTFFGLGGLGPKGPPKVDPDKDPGRVVLNVETGQMELKTLALVGTISKVMVGDVLDLGKGLMGKVLALNADPGKVVGIELNSVIPNGHSCDRRGVEGCCWWLTKEQLEAMLESSKLES